MRIQKEYQRHIKPKTMILSGQSNDSEEQLSSDDVAQPTQHHNHIKELTIVNQVKSCWKPPEVGSTHWDGKLMDTLGNRNAKEERLPVLLSGMVPLLLFAFQ